ncbi:MAG: restriction endonuclease [Phycisphaeraceae bacterium]|nr:restriction endonuclease [Phycisphaeraceae bacterium]
MNESLVHHYPPELMALLINAVPRLIKGKRDVLTFFTGCGVTASELLELSNQVQRDRDSITKFEIVRRVLTRLNERGDAALAQRREVLKRVTQWDNFSTCYDNDRMEAKGYVAEIAKLVNIKDSFTRMNQEREKAEQDLRRRREAAIAERHRVKVEREEIRANLNALFLESNASWRGTALEGVLNRLFKSHGILIRDAFRRVGDDGEGVIEQIDGVVELDGHVYLVEMKWRAQPLGVGEVSHHLVRVFNRSAARGLLISQSGFTEPAITTCRESLAKSVFLLGHLSEIVLLLERDGCLKDLIRAKVRAAIVDKKPLV